MENANDLPIDQTETEETVEFDFDYITKTLGLIPIQDGVAAFNPGALTDIYYDCEDEVYIFTLHGGETYSLDDEEMAELETTIRDRQEAARQLQAENIRANLKAQMEAMSDMRGAVAPGQGMILGSPNDKRFRQ